jgi:hypothetical protein
MVSEDTPVGQQGKEIVDASAGLRPLLAFIWCVVHVKGAGCDREWKPRRLGAARCRSSAGFLGLGYVEPTKGDISYQKYGGIAGISTFIEHLPDGVDFAVLFNASPKRGERDESFPKRKSIIHPRTSFHRALQQ